MCRSTSFACRPIFRPFSARTAFRWPAWARRTCAARFGTFTYFTDEESQKTRQLPGGQIVHVNLNDHADLQIQAPPTLRKDKSTTYVDMTVDMDPDGRRASTIADQQVILQEGEWSDWIQVRFPLIPELKSAAGMVRIFAKKFRPNLQVYVSPVNIDPTDPELPITAPESYSRDLAKSVGLFYTQGMAQDTAAYRQGVFNARERQVLRADHHRHQKISQHRGDRRNHEKENHHDAMRGEEFVVSLRLYQRALRSDQVQAHQHRRGAADEKHECDGDEIEQGDALVVHSEEPRADPVIDVQIIHARIRGNFGGGAHLPPFAWAPSDFTYAINCRICSSFNCP